MLTHQKQQAIRITHIPTGIIIVVDHYRSQHKNKEMALKILKSKLYMLQQGYSESEIKYEIPDEDNWGHELKDIGIYRADI